MSMKSVGRSIEKHWLRPFMQRLKRIFPAQRSRDRVGRLEQRVEELESLLREQAGLHYLRLAEQEDASFDGLEPAPGRRTA